jgi:hypothetical protein
MFQTKFGADHKVDHQYRALAAEIEWRVTNRQAFIAGTLPPADPTNLPDAFRTDVVEESAELLVVANG